ncbi:Alpha/Beta hydrolase protein [Hyaloraphidium curvatum]|nr:Alpha/Beta hydrolase protein [Hyaloraphidium curvatum]
MERPSNEQQAAAEHRRSQSALQKRWRRLSATARFLLPHAPGLAASAASYFLRGPPRKSWNLQMTLLMSLLAGYMDKQAAGAAVLESAGEGADRFRKIGRLQDQLNRPVKLPPHIAQEYVGIPRSTKAVDFLRSKVGDVVEPAEHTGTVAAEWVRHPDAVGSSRTILFLHGGAYIFGSSDGTHRWLTTRLSKGATAQVLGVNYRLSPQHAFPAALIDALSAYLYLVEDLSIPQDHITILGDSAGGNLSLCLRVALAELLPSKAPANVVFISPWCDLTHSLPVKTRGDYLPVMGGTGSGGAVSVPKLFCPREELLKHRLVSPLFAPRDALAWRGTRVLVQVGQAERLFGEGFWMWKRIAEANPSELVRLEIYEDMPHVHHAFLFLPAARTAIQRICDFVTAPADPAREVLMMKSTGQIDPVPAVDWEAMLRKIGEPVIGGADEAEGEKEMEVLEDALRSKL